MNAKYGLRIGACAVGLLALSVALRGGRDEAREVRKNGPSRISASSSGPADLPPLATIDGKGTGLAEALAGRLEAAQGMEDERRALELPYTEEESARLELVRSESRQLAERLAARLKARPDEWEDVFAVLGVAKTATRALGMISELGGTPEDTLLIELLREGSTPRPRLLAARLLRFESSAESLQALMAAAEGDESPQVRMDALRSLLGRRGQGENENESLAVAATIRGLAQGDPDPGIRRYAAGIKLEPAAEASTTPVPRSRSSRLTRQIKTNWPEDNATLPAPR